MKVGVFAGLLKNLQGLGLKVPNVLRDDPKFGVRRVSNGVIRLLNLLGDVNEIVHRREPAYGIGRGARGSRVLS